MKRRALLLVTLPLPLASLAAPPALPLVIELRWVDSRLAPAAQGALRDGAVVTGTAGSVSPRGAGVVTATAMPAPEPPQRLVVLNGRSTSLRVTAAEPLQWLDAVVELDARGATRRIHVSPQPQRRETTAQAFTVTPNWPGGHAPVRVAFSVNEGGQRIESTLDLPLDRWQAVARSGGNAPPAAPGTLSSRDAAAQAQRELQLRVSLKPD